MKEHFKRWQSYFHNEPWWEMYQALYEGPGSDWEGASEALDQIAYQLAKARGLDTTQTCPSCKLVRDEVTTFTEWRSCAACETAEEARQEKERKEWEAQRERERIARENMLKAMTPQQREAFLSEEKAAFQGGLYGLFHRDVQ